MASPSKAPQYAVVAYVKDSLGHFVEELRRDLHPDHTHLAAHVTVLPPRQLQGSEDEAIRTLKRHAPETGPFKIVMGTVETFSPATPTVFIRVEKSAHRFRDLHDRLNQGALYCAEEWPYMPHMTIVKLPEASGAAAALAQARARWAEFQGDKAARIEEVTFVREGSDHQWIDIATVKLRQP
jgi:2'-5' RNA ligase